MLCPLLFVLESTNVYGQNSSINWASIEDWIRMRCSLNPLETTVVEWSGPVYALQPQKQQEYLFDVYGRNLARCWWNETLDSYLFSSRELQYYLDKKTKQPMTKWTNPWTNETLTVEHTANDPVQFSVGKIGYTYDLFENGEMASFPSAINLFYENPLQNDDWSDEDKKIFLPYSHQKFYESTELFKFFVAKKELQNQNIDSAPMHFSWSRFSQFMPWMKTEQMPGSLLFTAEGGKVPANLESAPEWYQKEVSDENRIPIYANAPNCYENSTSITSWVYFGMYFDEYLKGERFPMPAVEEPKCKYDLVTEENRRSFKSMTTPSGANLAQFTFIFLSFLLTTIN